MSWVLWLALIFGGFWFEYAHRLVIMAEIFQTNVVIAL